MFRLSNVICLLSFSDARASFGFLINENFFSVSDCSPLPPLTCYYFRNLCLFVCRLPIKFHLLCIRTISRINGSEPLNVISFLFFYFQVSWIRKRDLHILTVGILTYTNDQRYQSLHSDGSDEWTLKISSPQIRDTGTYECQVSTEPKISQGFRLSVVGK